MGTNIISNISDSSFIGMNLSDYINFYENNDLISLPIGNRFAGFFFGTNDGYEKLNRLSS